MEETKESRKNQPLLLEQSGDVVGKIPSWVIRWGTILVLSVFVFLLMATFVFRYPDVISARITVTAENPPAPVMARVTAKISELKVADKQFVKKGELLAVLQNPADYSQVMSLYACIDSFFIGLPNSTLNFEGCAHYYKLGEIQADYAQFMKAVRDYRNFITLDYHSRKIQLLEKEARKYEEYMQQLNRQRLIMQHELDLASNQMARDSSIYLKGVTAPADFEKAQSVFLQKKYAFEEAGVQLSKTKIQLSESEQSILELQLQKKSEDEKLSSVCLENAQQLKGKLDIWSQQYMLRSPVAGKITFHQFWSVNQEVKEKERVFTVIPIGIPRIIGKLNLLLARSGKVKKGQRVNIKFDNFPYMEYGMVRGQIESISLVPADNVYNVEVSLPDSLRTNYGNRIPFQQEMQGNAEIITEDARLIERIANPLRNLFRSKIYRSEN
jgi:multidrug efflux pump subunit AcrA (membrane-fusion protein)